MKVTCACFVLSLVSLLWPLVGASIISPLSEILHAGKQPSRTIPLAMSDVAVDTNYDIYDTPIQI